MTIGTAVLDPAHLRRLIHFLAVARAGGFRRAATTAGVRQPTLTKSVAELEVELGAPVFVRSASGVALTELGTRVLARCDALEALIRSPLDESPAELSGEVRVATHEHVAACLFPAWIRLLVERHPKLAVRVTTGAGHRLIREIEAGVFDFGVFASYPARPSLTRRTLGHFECRLVVAAGQAVTPGVAERFIGSRELDDEAGRIFPTLEHLQRRHPSARIAHSCNSLEAQKQMVLAGLGVAVLPQFVMHRELADGRLELLDAEYVYDARLDVVRLPGRRSSAQVRAALDALDDALPRRSDGSLGGA